MKYAMIVIRIRVTWLLCSWPLCMFTYLYIYLKTNKIAHYIHRCIVFSETPTIVHCIKPNNDWRIFVLVFSSWLWSSVWSSCCASCSRFWKPMRLTGNMSCASFPLCWFTTHLPSRLWKVATNHQVPFIWTALQELYVFLLRNKSFCLSTT